MIQTQLSPHMVLPDFFIQALLSTPRQKFIPPLYRGHYTADRNFPLEQHANKRFLLTPLTLTRLLFPLFSFKDQSKKILLLAGGSGYSAALIHQLGFTIFFVENQDSLLTLAQQNLAAFDNISFYKKEDLKEGLPEEGPFDCILVDGGALCEIPPLYVQQLSKEGFILALLKGSSLSQDKVPLCQGIKQNIQGDKEILFDAFAPVNLDLSLSPTFSLDA